MGHRRKNGAPRADYDLDFSSCNLPPVPAALRGRQMAVQYRHVVEPLAEPLLCLRRQADFGNQHDCLPAELDDSLNRLDVDFGLAASGDAMQQNGFVPAAFQCLVDRIQSALLVDVELPVLDAPHRGQVVGFLFDADLGLEDQTFFA